MRLTHKPARVADARLSRRLGLDWLAAPFTRCLVDGASLKDASAAEVAGDVPEAARERGGPFHRCPDYARLFWPGSHVRRMRARLETLATEKDRLNTMQFQREAVM